MIVKTSLLLVTIGFRITCSNCLLFPISKAVIIEMAFASPMGYVAHL